MEKYRVTATVKIWFDVEASNERMALIEMEERATHGVMPDGTSHSTTVEAGAE